MPVPVSNNVRLILSVTDDDSSAVSAFNKIKVRLGAAGGYLVQVNFLLQKIPFSIIQGVKGLGILLKFEMCASHGWFKKKRKNPTGSQLGGENGTYNKTRT